MKKIIIGFVLMGVVLISSTISGFAETSRQIIVFSQVTPDGKALYLADADGGNLRMIHSGSDLSVYLEQRHILYLTGGELYEYKIQTGEEKRLVKLEEPTVRIVFLPEGPDQALIVGTTLYESNYYVLDLADGNLRRVSPKAFPSNSGKQASKMEIYSENRLRHAVLRSSMKGRFDLGVWEGKVNKWTLPRTMTVLPESPVWSPDSLKLVFFAKDYDGLDGFYSLYMLDFSQNEVNMDLIQEAVFNKYYFSNLNSEGFRPVWDKDSTQLFFSYLPYGGPSQSSIMKYAVKQNQMETLFNHASENYYPKISTLGSKLLFLSNRDQGQFQLFLTEAPWKEVKQISPRVGYTEWAEWYVQSVGEANRE